MRSPNNPILSAQPELSWCSKKIYNCAVFTEGPKTQLLFRGVGEDWVSRLGLAESHDGINFKIDPLPVMSPEHSFERSGIEDPRLVKFDDRFYVTYTAFDGKTARAAIATSIDLHNWTDRQLLFPSWNTQQQRPNLPTDWSKAAGLFPQTINHKYYLLFGDNHIWSAVSNDLINWEPMHDPILSPRSDKFDMAYIEMGPPPVLTDYGWLVLYHGIDRLDNQRTYRLGAALFALNDPLKLLWRCNKPILQPEMPYEVLGLIDLLPGSYKTLQNLDYQDLQALADKHQLPKAIFCCGAVLEADNLQLFYSGADTVLCQATVDLDTVFSC